DPLRLVALARQEVPEVIGLDLSIPNDGAWRVLPALRGDRLNGPTKAVLLVPEEGSEEETSIEIGSFWMLPKPISIEHTLEAVKLACGQIAGSSAVLADPDVDLRRIMGEALASAGCSVRGAE